LVGAGELEDQSGTGHAGGIEADDRGRRNPRPRVKEQGILDPMRPRVADLIF
jgi:hypothetical protein